MRIKAKRGELLKGLQRVQGVVERRITMPILANTLFAAEAGVVRLYATDLELGLQAQMAADVQEAGSVALPTKKLYEIVRELPEGEVNLTVSERQWATVASGKSHFRLASPPAEDFPPVAVVTPEAVLQVEPGVLRALIAKTLFAAGENDARYILNGLQLTVRDRGNGQRFMRLVGTDGHRLAMAEAPAAASPDLSVVVARKAMIEIRRLLEEEEGPISLGVGQNQLVVRRGQVTLTSRLMEGAYPDYQQVIPKESPRRVVVDRGVLEGALRRVSLVAKEKTQAVKLSLEADTLRLAASNAEVGEAREEIPVQYRGEPLTTGFNARYLIDALGAMEGQEATLGFQDALSPCVVRQGDGRDSLCVVMPMRI